jgi:hypothetical protein
MFKRHTLFLVLFTVLAFDGFGQSNPSAQSLPYSQDFSTLTHASTTYPAGWQGWTVSTSPGATFNTATPSADRSLVASSTANTTSGNVHNYNGKIGFLNTGSLDLSLVLVINTTGKTSVEVDYDVMTIRNPHDGGSNTRINEVTLQYRVGTSGAFTTLTGIEYQNNTTTQTTTVTTPQNSSSKTITLPSACDDESIVQLRWVSRQVSGSGNRPSFAVDNISITGTDAPTPPTLTADATDNTVDNEIDITFTEDATWRAAVTAVKIGSTALTVSTDYVLSAGNLKLKPAGANVLLTTSGSKSVTVEATGYSTASVTQQIDAGAPTSNSTASISAALALSTTRTVTATAKDQYNNLVSGYAFKYDATITDANATTDESYTIDGTARTATVSDINVVATTNLSGIATFDITLPALVDGSDGISVQVQLSNGTTSIGSAFSFTGQIIPPVLTADATLNTVDNNIDITFPDDPAWRAAITAVKIGVTALTLTTDYVISAGNLQLKPSGLNALLTTSGSKSVTVEATGYNVASVTQQIDAGAPTGNSTATISSALALNTSRTITATAKDQYNNLVAGYSFKYDATITDANATTDESYTIDGTSRTTSVTDIALVASTNVSGVATFSVTIPATVDETDGVSVQVQLTDGTTNIGSAFSYTKQPVLIMISHLSADYAGASDELVVLFNNTSSDFDLNGYELQYFSAAGGTGALTTFSSSTIIPSKKHRLLSPNATVTAGSVSVARDGSLSSGMGTSGQMVLRETATPTNILYAVAWGTVTSYVAGMTDAATWSGDGMISLSPSGTTYTRTDYNASNSQYSHTLSASITNIPNSSGEPLPVELTSFTARAVGSAVNLNWETATEVDNNGFDVERNSTGTWQKIGFVEGHGTANSPKYYTFTDKSVTGNKIQYRLRQVDNDGAFEYSNVVEVELAPTTFALDQNYPNPFNPATMIRFSLPTASVVTLTVYNTLGEKVAMLLNGPMESGYHQVSFDAVNLPSGLYLYEIKAGEFSSIKKMVLLK